MTAAPNFYAKARAEVASMLRYDLDNLSAEQATRLDIATALRVLLDTQTGRLLRGESLDARELLMASDALAKILPSLAEPQAEQHLQDPREVMFKIYMEMRERGEVPPEGWHQHRINALQAENEQLRAQLVAGGLTPALPDVSIRMGTSTAIDPPLADIVPPSERAECDAGVKPGPDDWRAQRSTAIIEGKPNPSPPRPAWEDWLDAQQGGYGGRDRWGNYNGA